ncbi:hypothetical protein [Symbiopectobacterium purcellii]|uniref:hypothetical protein n=1 Tax=Symbiopectobacterium purcellii TaxID=2871826 RepID=UPI003F8342D2
MPDIHPQNHPIRRYAADQCHILRRVRAGIDNRLKNDYILCPDMRQRSIAGCYQNNVAWLYR